MLMPPKSITGQTVEVISWAWGKVAVISGAMTGQPQLLLF